MPFNLFHKKKQQEPEIPTVPPQEEPPQEAPAPPIEETPIEPAAPATEPMQEPIDTSQETTPPIPEPPPETVPAPAEEKPTLTEPPNKIYLKAMPLRDLSDLENIKIEVEKGNIIILRVTPLAGKSIEDVKTAVNDLFQFAESIGGDIARLGEERVVICPKTIRIWREKTPAPVSRSNEPLPTAA
jgi:SepF-like predicted cell division protein (DUF552 family)